MQNKNNIKILQDTVNLNAGLLSTSIEFNKCGLNTITTYQKVVTEQRVQKKVK